MPFGTSCCLRRRIRDSLPQNDEQRASAVQAVGSWYAALTLAAAIRTGCKAWSSRAAATRFGYVLHAFHQLLALILLSSTFLPDVRTRLRSAPSPPAFGRTSRRLRPHFPPIADAPPTGCDHTSHRMRPLGSDLHRSLPLSHALPIDCGHTSRLSGHSDQIYTMPKRKNPFDQICTPFAVQI